MSEQMELWREVIRAARERGERSELYFAAVGMFGKLSATEKPDETKTDGFDWFKGYRA